MEARQGAAEFAALRASGLPATSGQIRHDRRRAIQLAPTLAVARADGQGTMMPSPTNAEQPEEKRKVASRTRFHEREIGPSSVRR